MNLIYREESFAVMGACFEVYKEMGCGFLESVYHECLTKEFIRRGIPFTSQRDLQLHYKGEVLQQTYRADFVCFDKIIVEIKSVSQLLNEYRAQLINYLHASGFELGLLVNFGHHPKVEYERIALTRRR